MNLFLKSIILREVFKNSKKIHFFIAFKYIKFFSIRSTWFNYYNYSKYFNFFYHVLELWKLNHKKNYKVCAMVKLRYFRGRSNVKSSLNLIKVERKKYKVLFKLNQLKKLILNYKNKKLLKLSDKLDYIYKHKGVTLMFKFNEPLIGELFRLNTRMPIFLGFKYLNFFTGYIKVKAKKKFLYISLFKSLTKKYYKDILFSLLHKKNIFNLEYYLNVNKVKLDICANFNNAITVNYFKFISNQLIFLNYNSLKLDKYYRMMNICIISLNNINLIINNFIFSNNFLILFTLNLRLINQKFYIIKVKKLKGNLTFLLNFNFFKNKVKNLFTITLKRLIQKNLIYYKSIKFKYLILWDYKLFLKMWYKNFKKFIINYKLFKFFNLFSYSPQVSEFKFSGLKKQKGQVGKRKMLIMNRKRDILLRNIKFINNLVFKFQDYSLLKKINLNKKLN
jgi:hypothetical protein